MVDRSRKLIQKIRTEWDNFAAENPDIDWGASSLDIDLTGHAFEEMAHDYLVGKSINKEAFGEMFQAHMNAYKEASV